LVNYSRGTGHTAGIFAQDEKIISKFQDFINAGRIIVNQPTSLGGLGGIYNNLSTTLSFGCGTGGGNSTTDNVNIYNLLNIKRVPRRQTIPAWFKVPKEIHLNHGSLAVLKNIKEKNIFIITSKTIEKNGLDKILSNLPSDCTYRIFSGVEPEPSKELIYKVLSQTNDFNVDAFIALGGGSVIDAAKAIRLFYEYPDLKLEDLAVDFLDFRKRIVNLPKLSKTRLIAIPTTSGTGSEVSPACVISDKENSKKISLFDYELTPDIAIVDAALTVNLPLSITADTGIDALTHAIESYISVYANDFTEGYSIQALEIIYEYLPKVLKEPANIVYRQKMHDAATLAGMAFSNASVGINHALAHSLGMKFGIPHGRANAVFLLSSIDYNSKVPMKYFPFSNYKKYIAPEKYAKLAQCLGCKGNNTDELIEGLKSKIKSLLKKIEMPHRVCELDIKLDSYINAMPELVDKAFSDLSIRTNPRLPLIGEIEELFKNAY